MREVVVLPFVPATTTAPRVSCAEILPRSFGSIRSATRPGAAVPPPLPNLRLAVETLRAALTASTSLGSGRSSDMRLGQVWNAVTYDEGEGVGGAGVGVPEMGFFVGGFESVITATTSRLS